MNDACIVSTSTITVSLETDPSGMPVARSIRVAAMPDIEWAADGGSPLAPVIEAGAGTPGTAAPPDPPALSFLGFAQDGSADTAVLRYSYRGVLEVRQTIRACADLPALQTSVSLRNVSGAPLEGIGRCDSLAFTIGVSDHEPEASYLLGWLDTPRLDAPGRPPVAVRHDNWLDKLRYEGAPTLIPPLPEAGWTAPTMRLVTERLTNLPLRSGKRGTWDNYPWAVVRDPGRQAGFFLGLEWSGTWRIDLDHSFADARVRAVAGTDAYRHALEPGGTLEAPPAFLGFFRGDRDDAFNACRRYSAGHVIPRPPAGFPFVHYVFFPGGLLGGSANRLYYTPYGDDTRRRVRSLVDAAADMGAESFLLDALWWGSAVEEGDFSVGLGDFTVNARRFPDGLKALSDYVHEKGMVFGLWFEFERVDIRTANTGPHPWKPEWIMHQNGMPYRSWGQHFFMLCLGHRPAADWVLESLSRAIADYGVDWFMIDSNEWAVCRDPTHTHGAEDGEWAQIQGLYRVLRGLRERFPKLIIDNGAGGAQRGDFGMARLCDVMPCSDINCPSVLNRQYSHGFGCFYPTYYARQSIYYYPTRVTGPVSRKDPTPYTEPWHPMRVQDDESPERMEWRLLCRMMGVFQPIYDLSIIPPAHLAVLKRAVATYKELRPTLHGDRYVLRGPAEFVERENRESDRWEAYEHVCRDGSLASVLFYRCLSPEAGCTVRLRGLDPSARYRAEFHSGRPAAVLTGAELMSSGYTCRLERPRTAEAMILRRETR